MNADERYMYNEAAMRRLKPIYRHIERCLGVILFLPANISFQLIEVWQLNVWDSPLPVFLKLPRNCKSYQKSAKDVATC